VWYIDTPDALFMERDRVVMRNHSGEFVAPLMAEAAKQFANITLVTMDVTSVPLLRGLRQWQTQASEADRAKLATWCCCTPASTSTPRWPGASGCCSP
jgi:hypothetical protein